MSHTISGADSPADQSPGYLTLREIYSQPDLWPVTFRGVRSAFDALRLQAKLHGSRVLITGAGSSAYAARAIAAAWPGALAVPTTDLLLDAERSLEGVDCLISLARSGDSPESAAVVECVRALRPEVWQLGIVCNQDSALAQAGLDELIALDPRTNDRSLVMTSSFSNLVLAGYMLARPALDAEAIDTHSRRAAALLPQVDDQCRRVAARVTDRIVVLSSSPLVGWGLEAGLKTLEMSVGRFPAVSETFLGLRHGPMSFVTARTLVLCLLSNHPLRRAYEKDLIDELRAKKLGYLVGIADPATTAGWFDETIPAVAPTEDDALRTPYEIACPQLLGYHLSRRIGLDPDNPSPDGIINRVVQGVRIHQAPDRDRTTSS